MASVEHEQPEAQQKYKQVKEELVKLKAAIKKQEQQSLSQETKPKVQNKAELFINEHKTEEKDILVARQRNADQEVTSEQRHQFLDVSPGDHTVVEL